MTEQVRRHIYRTNGTIPLVFFTGLAWLVAGLYAVFGFDLLEFLSHHDHHDHHDPAVSGYIYLILATGVPIGTGIWAWFKIRRALYLAQYGVEVNARVTSVGIAIRGWCHLHYEFDVASRVIAGKMSVVKSEATEYRDGKKPFVLIVDPARPEKFMLKNDIFPRAGKWNWWSGYQNEPKATAD